MAPLLQGNFGDEIEPVMLALFPILIGVWVIVIGWVVVRKKRPRDLEREVPVNYHEARSMPDGLILDYQNPATLQEERLRRSSATYKTVGRFGVGIALVILCIVTVLAGITWFESTSARRYDERVRQWMDGPRTDPVTSVRVMNSQLGMEAKLVDAASLAYFNAALPGASRGFPNPQGRYVEIELRFQSGRVIETSGGISLTVLTIENPSGDRFEDWDVVTLSFPGSAPRPLLDMLSFAEKGSGKQSF